MRKRKWTGVVAVAAVTAGVLAGTASGATAAPAGTGSARVESVTLISGDRVTVSGSGDRKIPQVHPGPGRAKMTFSVTGTGGHSYVVPSDAKRLIDSGKLDRRLFDVTALLSQGYGDAARDSLPLIVRGADGGRVAARSAGATVTAELPSVRSQAVRQPKARMGEFWNRLAGGGVSAFNSGVEKIWLDGKVSASLKESVPQIGAPRAWQAGFTGKGVKVAVLDTGVDATHPDLRGRVAQARNFSGTADAVDHNGHGTHVASTIAGSGGVYKGVAPDSTLLVGKVLDDEGSGPESSIIAGMQWAAEQGARLVSMSLGGRDQAGVDPMEQAVNELSERYKVLFVVAAGNEGPGAGSLGSPGTADAALTVGAVDKADRIAPFSSRGPRAGDGAIKPDITAPGVGIVAARAAGTGLGKPVDAEHTMLDGTSMATPHVAGAAALLAQQHPDWTGQQLKAALMGSARPDSTVDAFTQGAGRVDVGAATAQPVYATPASVSAGRPQWPHGDDKPVTTPVTYHNAGTTPLTLDVAVAARVVGGTPSPDGMFTVDKRSVEVPAGGSATVNVTVNTAVPGPEAVYTGQVTATGKGVTVVTPVAVDKEPESYNVTLKYVDRNGKAPQNYVTVLDGRTEVPFEADGDTTVRLAKGKHELASHVDTMVGDTQTMTTVLQPALNVAGDTSVVIDARLAKQVDVTVDTRHQGIELLDNTVALLRPNYYIYTRLPTLQGNFLLHVGESLPRDEMRLDIIGIWGRPGTEEDSYTSPVVYQLAWSEFERVPTGFTRRVSDSSLAEVHADYRSLPRQYSGLKALRLVRDGQLEGGIGWPISSALAQRTEYYNVDSGTTWAPTFSIIEEKTGSSVTELVSKPLTMKAGRTYQESWNTAVYGPAFPVGDNLKTRLGRTGNTLKANIPLFSDSPDRYSEMNTAKGTTTLYRDGQKVASAETPGQGEFEVPAAGARYRLETTATQDIREFSTAVSAAWTFTSANQPGDRLLPAQAIRFAPCGLDRDNRAASGSLTLVPITVDRYGQAARLSRLSVEVSFDDGVSWRAVPVFGTTVAIAHPGKPGYVSLRAKAADTDGNTVEQTILRAYGLK